MNQIILDKVSKSFRTNNYVVKAVTQAEFAINAGEAVAIIGPSGSGKSTLLNMLGLILSPDDGQIIIDGKDVTNMPDNVLCCFRNSNFGYIVQDFALLDQESVYSNIRIPLLYSKKSGVESTKRVYMPQPESLEYLISCTERPGNCPAANGRESLSQEPSLVISQ